MMTRAPFSKQGLALLVALLSLVGCHGGRSLEAEHRQLNLRKITGFVEGGASHNQWSLLTERRISVQACLEESSRNEKIGSGHYRVTGEGQPELKGEATTDGCVSWIETLNFEPAAQPTYLPMTRTLTDVNGNYNPVAVRFFINPWSGFNGSEVPVLDARFDRGIRLTADTAEAKASALAGTDRQDAGLYFNRLTHDFRGQAAHLNLFFKPLVKTLAMDGSPAYLPIETGRINLKATLLYRETPTSSLTPMHDPIVVNDVPFADRQINLLDLNLARNGDWKRDHGTYYVQLALTAQNGSPGLRPFSGLFQIGSYDQLAANTDNLVDQTAPAIAVAPRSGSPTIGGTFRLQDINPMLNGPLDESQTERHLRLTLDVAVSTTNPNEESLEGQIFRISSMDGGTGVYQDVPVVGGKLHWVDSIHHNFYERIRELRRPIYFTQLRTGSTLSKNLDVTPWVRYLVLAVDEDTRANPNQPFINVDERLPRLRLESACFIQDQRRYGLDLNSLNLHLTYPITFQFSPQIRRFDEPIFGMNTFESLRPGYYLVTMALFNPDSDGGMSQPVSVAQKVVLHRGGLMAAQMDLPLYELSYVRLRNFAVVQVDFLNDKTLRLANGQLVDPAVASAKDLEVVSGTVVERSRLALTFPPLIMPFQPSPDGCAKANSNLDFSDPKLSALAKRFTGDQMPMLRIADLWRQRHPVSALAVTGEREENGWRDAAKRWGLAPIALNSPADAKQIGYDDQTALDDIRDSLECAFQTSNQTERMPAKCLYQKRSPLAGLCRAIGVTWAEELQRDEARLSPAPRMQRLNMLPALYMRHCMDAQQIRQVLKVRKYVLPYRVSQVENLAVHQGYAWNLNLRDGIALGTDSGTEYMHEDAITLALALAGKLKFAPGQKVKPGEVGQQAARMMQTVGMVPGGDITGGFIMQQVEATYEGASKIAKNLGVSMGVSGVKEQRSFRWVFNYQIPYRFVGFTLSTDLMMESLGLDLNVERARTCYSIEADLLDPVEWESLLVATPFSGSPRPRFLVCFAPRNFTPAAVLSERYFFAYNNPSAGALIDNGRAKNRMFIGFRGNRDYSAFLQNLQGSFGLMDRGGDQVPEPIYKVLNDLPPMSLLDRPVYPGIITANAPGDEKFDLLENQENGYFARFKRWWGREFNPDHTYGATQNKGQNNPRTRRWHGDPF